MDSQLEHLSSSPVSGFQVPGFLNNSTFNAKASLDQTVISSLNDDAAVIDLTAGSGVDIQKVIDKINELLKSKLPEGVQSLNPDEYTSEKTSDRIVSGIEALFARYVESNPDLDAHEAIKRFMAAARSGVESGYSSAYSSLDSAGAFGLDGIKDGVEGTKKLIDQKLSALEERLKTSYALDIKEEISGTVSSEVTSGAGTKVSSLNLTV